MLIKSPVDSSESDESSLEHESIQEEHGSIDDDSGESSENDFAEENNSSSENGESCENGDSDMDDELILKIEERKEVVRTKPSPILFKDDLLLSLSLHPRENLISLTNTSGNIFIYSYNLEENVLKGEIEAHIGSIYGLEFSPDGKTLYSAGHDKHIVFSNMETLDMKMFISDAHHTGISALCVLDDNILLSGDDEGVVKIWDTRYTQSSVFKAHDCQAAINNFVYKEISKFACSSDDGTVTSYDFRARKKLHQSEPYETAIVDCASTHNDTVIVCGTETNYILFYKWNDVSQIGIFKTPQDSLVSSLVSVSDNIVLCGMDQGLIKAYHFFPHKEIGIVGQHKTPVSLLDVSHDGSLIATCSYDEVKFWDISYLEGFVLNDAESTKVRAEINLPSSEFDDRKTFFSDLS